MATNSNSESSHPVQQFAFAPPDPVSCRDYFNNDPDPDPAILIAPKILVVSRRHVRKNKFVDFVGEFHLDLVTRFGGVPIIVPRVPHIGSNLDAFEPIHGVLLIEGEDIDPRWYGQDLDTVDPLIRAQVFGAHPSDVTLDYEKDTIEIELMRRCITRGIPFLGLCRGSQMMNVASGGTLYFDIDSEVKGHVKHIDYDNYDGYRHVINVVAGTPLKAWFQSNCISVNSYHHQGIKDLAHRFKPMAYSDDGLIEAYYDPKFFDPKQGKFHVGLQFHPERMQDIDKHLAGEEPMFEYDGCWKVYQDFVTASIHFKRLNPGFATQIEASTSLPKETDLTSEHLLSLDLEYHIKSPPFEHDNLGSGTFQSFHDIVTYFKTSSINRLDQLQGISPLDRLPLAERHFLYEHQDTLTAQDLDRLENMGVTVRGGSLFKPKEPTNLRRIKNVGDLEIETVDPLAAIRVANELGRKLGSMSENELLHIVGIFSKLVDSANEELGRVSKHGGIYFK